MRVKKDIQLTWNGDSDKVVECSFEYDDWYFSGTKEEVLEQIESLLGEMEMQCERGIDESLGD